jgi:hypothetical protein
MPAIGSDAAKSVTSERIPLSPPLTNDPLIFPIVALNGIEQLFGVVSDAVFEDDFDVFDIRDASTRVTCSYLFHASDSPHFETTELPA